MAKLVLVFRGECKTIHIVVWANFLAAFLSDLTVTYRGHITVKAALNDACFGCWDLWYLKDSSIYLFVQAQNSCVVQRCGVCVCIESEDRMSCPYMRVVGGGYGNAV